MTLKRFLPFARRVFAAGNAASLLSLLMLLRRCHREGHPLFCGINAVSHWLWGDRALRQSGLSWRYTALGMGIHHLSSLFWATWFAVASTHREAAPLKKIAARSVATTALAWVVDYHLTPKRLTPGFENIVSRKSLVWVYAAFATGLAAGAVKHQLRAMNLRR